ncbi:MAG: NADH-quinone oxidoreductase subunit A [Spirochaetes bacterium]|nr:NADH-quinone oxidoreductase subunit A [Spirochaetota bacterium]
MSISDKALIDLMYIIALFLGGLALVAAPIVISWLIAPRKTRQYANRTDQIIECGVEPIGDAWMRYGAVYYLYALMFIAFAVDVLFLFPVAVVYNTQYRWQDFIELAVFVGILSLVLIYAWKKDVFTWNRRKSRKA